MSKTGWLGKDGMKVRKKGMKKKESKQRKICYFAFFFLLFVPSFIISIVCFLKYGNANSINNDYKFDFIGAGRRVLQNNEFEFDFSELEASFAELDKQLQNSFGDLESLEDLEDLANFAQLFSEDSDFSQSSFQQSVSSTQTVSFGSDPSYLSAFTEAYANLAAGKFSDVDWALLHPTSPPYKVPSAIHKSSALAFDSCQFPVFFPEDITDQGFLDAVKRIEDTYMDQDAAGTAAVDAATAGTQWSNMYIPIAVWQLLSALNFIVMMFGAFYWYPRFFSSICNGCLSCCNCCIGFGVLAGLLAPYSQLCSYNIAPAKYEGDGIWVGDGPTYRDEFASLFAIDIVIILMLFFQCCACIPCLMTPIKESKKDKRTYNNQPAEQVQVVVGQYDPSQVHLGQQEQQMYPQQMHPQQMQGQMAYGTPVYGENMQQPQQQYVNQQPGTQMM